MSNIIIVCNTYSQLIIAVQMKQTIKKYDNVTVLITDQSNNSEKIYQNVKKNAVFDEVFYIQTKEFCRKQASRSKALWDIIHCIIGYNSMFSFLPKEKKYDEILFYNPDIATHCLFAILEARNKAIRLSRYEEGLISYDSSKFPIYRKLSIIYGIRRRAGRRNLQNDVERFYCMYPDFYKGTEEVVRIPVINETEEKFRQIICTVFDVNAQGIEYPCKYIYFSSVFDFEGEEQVDEVKLCKTIENLVGKQNLMVKVHPRDDANRFINADLIVDKMSSVPWEAIQLNFNFEKYIFLTLVSTSVITISSIVHNPPQVVFMYSIFKDLRNSVLQSAIISFEDIEKNGLRNILPNVRIVDSLEEIV